MAKKKDKRQEILGWIRDAHDSYSGDRVTRDYDPTSQPRMVPEAPSSQQVYDRYKQEIENPAFSVPQAVGADYRVQGIQNPSFQDAANTEAEKRARFNSQQAYNEYAKAASNMLENKRRPQEINDARENILNMSTETQDLLKQYVESRDANQNRSSTRRYDSNISDIVNQIAKVNTDWTEDQVKDALNMAYKVHTYDADKHKGLTQDEEVIYSQGKLQNLPYEERKVLEGIQQGQYGINRSNTEFMDSGRNSAQGQKGLILGTGLNTNIPLNAEEYAEVNEGKQILKDKYGWNDEKIEEYLGYTNRVASNQATNDYLKRQYSIDSNASGSEKFFKSAKNTLSSLDPRRAVMGGFQSLISNVEDKPEGFGRNIDSPVNAWNNAKDYARQQVTENAIESDFGKKAYNWATSTLDSAENMAADVALQAIGVPTGVTRLLSLSSFGANAYDSSYKEARQRGASETQAQQYAITSGLIEAGTELLPLDRFTDMAKNTRLGKEFFVNLLMNSGIEGMEEGVGDIATRLADEVIMGKDGLSASAISIDNYMKQYMNEDPNLTEEQAREMAVKQENKDFWSDTAEDILGGALSGLAMNAGAGYVGVQNSKQIDRMLKDTSKWFENYLQSDEYVNYTKEQAEAYAKNPAQYWVDNVKDGTEEGKELKKEMQEIANRVDEGKNLSITDRLELGSKYEQAEEAAQNDEAVKSSQELYEQHIKDLEQVPSEYRANRTNTTYEEGVKAMQEAIDNKDMQGLSDAYQSMQNSSSQEARSMAAEALDQMRGRAENNGISSIQIDGMQTAPQDAYLEGLKGTDRATLGTLSHEAAQAYNEGVQRAKERSTIRVANAENVTKDVQMLNGKKVNLTGEFDAEGKAITTEGKSIDIAEVDNKAVKTALLGASSYKNADMQKAYIEHLSDLPLNSYTEAADSFYTAGRTGLKFEDQIKSGRTKMMADTIGNDVVKDFYEIGANQRANELAAESNKELAKALDYKVNGTVNVSRKANIGKGQRAFLEYAANAFGLNIDVVSAAESQTQSGSRVRGNYVSSTGTITLADTDISSIFHELGHFGKDFASDDYAKLKKLVLKATNESIGNRNYTAVIKSIDNAYAFQNLSSDEITDEYVNNCLVGIMSSEKGQQKFSEILARNYNEEEAKNVFEKIENFFRSLINSIKEVVDKSHMSNQERMVYESNIKNMDTILKQFEKTMNNAIKEHKQEKEREGVEAEKKYAIEIDGSKFATTSDGKYAIINGVEVPINSELMFTVNDIRTEKNIVQQIVNDSLKEIANDPNKNHITIEEDGHEVIIDQDTADEYTYAESQKGDLNNAKAKTKYGIVNDVTEMIKKSHNKQYGVDKNGKHGDKAKRGWNYYDSEIVIKNGLGEYKVWKGLLNVRLDADGSDYAYDISDIKKVPANSIKAIKKANTSTPNVTPSNKTVKNSLDIDESGFYQFNNAALNEEESTKVFYQQEAGKGDPYIYIRNAKYVQNDTWKALAEIMYDDKNKWSYLKGEATKETSSRGYGIDNYFTSDILSYLSGDKVAKDNHIEKEIHVEDAEREFGTTTSFDKAGYLDTNGNLLDFSDGQGYRVRDHREIDQILDLPEDADYSDGLIQFMNEGNIRMQSYGIDISVAPNDKQIGMLRKFFRKLNGEVTVDFSKENGDTAGSTEYIEGTSSDRIIGDINNYFKTGEVPRGNSDSVLAFHYSIDTDSTGKKLSEGQQKFFNNSKIVDSEGRLKVMHHGSSDYGFTVFDIKKAKSSGLYGKGFYFTDSESHAGTYGESYNVYLNIVNPLQAGQNVITKDQMLRFIEELAADEDYGIENYGRDATPQSILSEIWGKDDFAMLQDLNATCVGDFAEAVKIFNKVNGTEYDGIVVPTETVAFYPNQIKNVDNENPTDDVDIRYALDIDDAFLDMLNYESDDVWTETKEDLGSILEKGIEALKGTEVDTKAIKGIASNIKSEYGSNIGLNKFTDMLEQAFAYMQLNDYVDYNDMISIFKEIATPVIEQATTLEGKEAYDEVVNRINGYKFRLTPNQMAEVRHTFGSYNDYRKALSSINISNAGNYDLDELWSSLVDASGGLLDIDTNEGDQPLALYDLLTSLKPAPVNNFNGNADEVAKNLAIRIIGDYFDMQANAKAKETARQFKERNVQYVAKIRDRYKQKLAEARESVYASRRVTADKIEEIAKLKAKNNKNMQMARERVEEKKQKSMITKSAKELMKWVTTPTDEHHVPKDLQEPIMEFLYAMDFVTPDIDRRSDGKYVTRIFDHAVVENGKRSMLFKTIEGDSKEEVIQKFYEAIGNGLGSQNQKAWTERMRYLNDYMAQINKDEDSLDNFLQTLDPELSNEFNEMLAKNNGKANINSLSAEDYKVMNKVLKGIMHAINQGNKAYTQNAEIPAMAQDTIKNAQSLKTKNHTEFVNKLRKMLIIDQASPETFFALQGEAGEKIFKSFNEGFNRKVSDIKRASEYMAEVMKDIKDIKKISGKDAEIHSFTVFDGKIDLTKAQIMSLYELGKRNQAVLHFKGGLIADTIGVKDHGIRKEQNQTQGVHLNALDLAKIIETLTPEEKHVADMMQQFMANECASWGNETSMMMYGYDKFTDPNYFPIKTDSNTIAATNNSVNVESLNGIEHMGMTKKVDLNARNPIVISDIFDVFTNHINNMAAYHGYAPAVKDANRWFNYKELFTDEESEDNFVQYTTVQQAINTNMGRTDKAGTNYYINFIKDINGQEKSNAISTPWTNIASTYKAASVAGNLRVVIQQPTAFMRAANVLKWKYMAKALPKMATASKELKRIKEISPTAWWKSQGYYETNVGKSLKEILTGTATVKDKIVEKSMWLAGKADDITWSILYNAAEKQVKAENPELKGDKFVEKVNELFDSTIAQTQVVDATIQKSQWMRGKDRFDKLLTAFMAEPTKSYNMAMKSMIQDYRKHGNNPLKWKATRKAFVVLALTDVLNSFAQSIIDGIRYKDDDDYLDTVLDYFEKNIVDNVNPLNRIPGVKDIWDSVSSALAGESQYGSSSGQTLEYQSMESIIDAISTTKKLFDGTYKKTGFGAYMTYAKAISNLTGIPLYNVSRDGSALWNLAAGEEYKLIKQQESASDKYNSFFNALDKEKSDDDLFKALDKAINKGGSIKEVESKIKNKYKEDYLSAFEEADTEGMEDIRKVMIRGFKAAGATEEDVDAVIEGWTTDKIEFSDLDKAITSGEGIEDTIKALKEAGKKDDAILTHVYDTFGSTIEYDRSRQDVDTEVEANVNKALQSINPEYKYGETKTTAMKKEELFKAIDEGSTDYKIYIDEMVTDKESLTSVKSALTSQYKEKYIALYNEDISAASKLRSQIATVKAYADKKGKFTGNGKKSYYDYEIDQIKDWTKKKEEK